MRYRNAVIGISLAFAAGGVEAQKTPPRGLPFTALAGSAGAVGFTAGGTSRSMLGGYGYVALSRLIVGAQGAASAGTGADVLYGMGTIGYPARSIGQTLVYPFVGVGRGVIHSGMSAREASAVFGAGIGADEVVAEDGYGLLVGFRGGYLFRPGDIGERAVYFSLAVGAGGRREPRDEPPPVIIAARQARGP